MRKFVIGAIIVAAATALFIAVYGHGRASEPQYQGRSLSYWLSVPEQRDYPDDSKLSPAAREAIRAIGTNAIPAALRWISYEPSFATLTLIKFMQNFAPVIGTTWAAKGDHFAFQAENIFALLGSDARAAIPELTRLAITSRSETRVWRCTRALGHIGPEGTLGLVDVLGAAAKSAVPYLQQALADPSEMVREQATNALLRIAPELLTNSVER